MILGSLGWKFLRFFVTEDVSEGSVLFQDSFVYFNLSDGGLFALYPGGKYCFVSVVGLEYNG